VTSYTLRHGGNYRADSLRNWDFQGSQDGKVWINLRRHNSDNSLNGNFATHTWAITGVDIPTPSTPTGNQSSAQLSALGSGPPGFRFFRILQKGHNSSDRNFMLLSGIELYGELFESNENYNIFRRSSRA